MESRKVFMARVGADTSYGGFVSPCFKDGTYRIIPIPEKNRVDQFPTYQELDEEIRKYVPEEVVVEGEKKRSEETCVHKDPEFQGNTYGEIKSKKQVYHPLKEFEEGDILLFYATFFRTGKDERFSDMTLSSLRRKQQGEKQYRLFSFLEFKYSLIDTNNYKEFEEEIQENPHYIRGDLQKGESFIVKGTERSRKLEESYRIDSGEIKGSNYQLKNSVAEMKIKNQDRKGVNRLYCRMDEEILEEAGIIL